MHSSTTPTTPAISPAPLWQSRSMPMGRDRSYLTRDLWQSIFGWAPPTQLPLPSNGTSLFVLEYWTRCKQLGFSRTHRSHGSLARKSQVSKCCTKKFKLRRKSSATKFKYFLALQSTWYRIRDGGIDAQPLDPWILAIIWYINLTRLLVNFARIKLISYWRNETAIITKICVAQNPTQNRQLEPEKRGGLLHSLRTLYMLRDCFGPDFAFPCLAVA